MNHPANVRAAQRGDHPLDLPPMAKARDIAGVTAGLGPHRGFETGVIAERVDQVRCVGKRCATGDVRCVHAAMINPGPLTRLTPSVVYAAFTMVLGAAKAGAAPRLLPYKRDANPIDPCRRMPALRRDSHRDNMGHPWRTDDRRNPGRHYCRPGARHPRLADRPRARLTQRLV